MPWRLVLSFFILGFWDLVIPPMDAAAVVLTSTGAGLVSPLIGAWGSRFLQSYNPTVRVNYSSTSSTVGIQAVIDRKVDFALSNVDIAESQYSNNSDLQMLPLAVVPLVFGYSLPNLTSTLAIPRKVLADIFAGQITKWDHPEIQSANPGSTLPNTTITVLVRQGEVGATGMLTEALSRFNSFWNKSFGVFSHSNGFNGSLGTVVLCKDDATMASKIATTPYTIGYMSLNAALSRSVPFAMITNARNVNSFPIANAVMQDLQTATALTARLSLPVIDLRGTFSYPTLTMVYAIIRMETMADCSRVAATTEFLRWVSLDPMAHQAALDAGYIPMPSLVVSSVLERLHEMHCADTNAANELIDVECGGTTPVGPMMDRWAFAYTDARPEIRLTYSLVGSSTGINQLISNSLHFAISDSNPTSAQLQKDPSLTLIPVLLQAAVLVFHLPEMDISSFSPAQTQLVWSRELIALVFNGTVQYWNDPLIRRLNPFITFPQRRIAIAAIDRSSGVSSLFRLALMSFDPTWAQFNADTSSEQPWAKPIRSSMVTTASHEATVAYVQTTPYCIGVVSYQSAYQANAKTIAIRNRAGQIVEPSFDTLVAANHEDAFADAAALMDGAGDDDYPIVGLSNFVLKSHITNAPTCVPANITVDFVLWATENASALAMARANGYVPAFSTPHPRVRELLKTFTCNGQFLIPLPVTPPVTELDLIPIVIPVVLGITGLVAVFGFGLWKLRARLKDVHRQLNDVQVAVELSDAIATLDLDRMAFLETIKLRTATQESCFRIFLTLKHVIKYVPQAVLDQLRSNEDDDESDDEEGDNAENEEETDTEGDAQKGNTTSKRKYVKGCEKDDESETTKEGRPSDLGSEQDPRLSVVSDEADKRLPMVATAVSSAILDSSRSGGPLSASKSGVSQYSYEGGGGGAQGSARSYIKNNTNNKAASWRRAVAVTNNSKRRTSKTGQSIQSGSTDAAGKEAKLVRRGITVLSLRIVNFLELLRLDASRTIAGFNSYMERALATINTQSGTIAYFDGDQMLVHWNASKRSASARVQACEAAAKLTQAALEYEFQISIGVCYGQSIYTNVGCDRMSSMAVLGPLWYRAELLHKLNECYGTSILVEEEVKQQSTSGGVELVDILDCVHPLFRIQKYKVYELDAKAANANAAAIDDEWLYAFQPTDADQKSSSVTQAKEWAVCADLFFKGEFAKAQVALREFIEKFGVDAKPRLAHSFLESLSPTTQKSTTTIESSPRNPTSSSPRSPHRHHQNLQPFLPTPSATFPSARQASSPLAAAAPVVHRVDPRVTFSILQHPHPAAAASSSYLSATTGSELVVTAWTDRSVKSDGGVAPLVEDC